MIEEGETAFFMHDGCYCIKRVFLSLREDLNAEHYHTKTVG